ncbi:cadmium resistance transporter [Glycomyces dulcitolivorans]|uniref:cadmium resistance transporter n=1 Tax=Glycomyces dulcitolivorans TaxID=2200759 RepID=UPI000DD3A8FE|nr:cadmium resistance transporter [Glycomyces dulcitolivorans]
MYYRVHGGAHPRAARSGQTLGCIERGGRDDGDREPRASQYLGFAAILVVAIAAAFGATFLPEAAVPYLGLLPLALGIRAAWRAWRARRTQQQGESDDRAAGRENGPRAGEVATVTFANDADNIGVYVPVFAAVGIGAMSAYVAVFLALVALWCAAGRYFATRPLIARALGRWGHVHHSWAHHL